MKIYTRTGDKGETSLYGGERISKDSLRVSAYGSIDELNCFIGLILSSLDIKKKKLLDLKNLLEEIQKDLFSIGSYLASGKKGFVLNSKDLESRVDILEKNIDNMTSLLPELRNFILPGGSIASGFAHVARTVCRRSEREIVALLKRENVDMGVLKYLNRLSDFLFTTARYINFIEKKKEIIWNR